MTPQLDTAKLTQNRKYYQLSNKPEIEFDVMKEMYPALGMHTYSNKTEWSIARALKWSIFIVQKLALHNENDRVACGSVRTA